MIYGVGGRWERVSFEINLLHAANAHVEQTQMMLPALDDSFQENTLKIFMSSLAERKSIKITLKIQCLSAVSFVESRNIATRC